MPSKNDVQMVVVDSHRGLFEGTIKEKENKSPINLIEYSNVGYLI